MPKVPLRVAIDTNIWISFLIGKTLVGLDEKIANDQVVILFSDELFNELIEVLHRPKFSKYFTRENIVELIELIHHRAEWIDIKKHFTDCRDSKDNFLLDLCFSGKGDFLVTNDQDLLVLNPFRNTRIIHYEEFNQEII
ncbi:MAG: putative toxin-antitoxin system toxin component, PIN family [Candidatus Marinimicrobia bacterium]|nr:putative toxin-antitoxin system toxin component, PIN family [Candidatus Neomarinimicrobiota bacterium]